MRQTAFECYIKNSFPTSTIKILLPLLYHILSIIVNYVLFPEAESGWGKRVTVEGIFRQDRQWDIRYESNPYFLIRYTFFGEEVFSYVHSPYHGEDVLKYSIWTGKKF
jgi:hypothetical protein